MKSSISRGVYNNIYRVNIPRISDAQVEAYFFPKRDKIIKIINEIESIKDLSNDNFIKKIKEKNINIPICSDHETWNGLKCQKYCPVKGHCYQFADNNYFDGDPELETF